MACQDGCYPVNIASCEDDIIISGLEVNQPYYYLITTRFGKVYQQLVSTDSWGNITIEASILPEGSLNKFNSLKLELRSGNDYSSKIQFTYEGNIYECVNVSFKDIEGEVDGMNEIKISLL